MPQNSSEFWERVHKIGRATQYAHLSTTTPYDYVECVKLVDEGSYVPKADRHVGTVLEEEYVEACAKAPLKDFEEAKPLQELNDVGGRGCDFMRDAIHEEHIRLNGRRSEASTTAQRLVKHTWAVTRRHMVFRPRWLVHFAHLEWRDKRNI